MAISSVSATLPGAGPTTTAHAIGARSSVNATVNKIAPTGPNSSSSSSATSSAIPSTATSDTSPEPHSCPPISLASLSISSPKSSSPPSHALHHSSARASIKMPPPNDVTSPIGTKPSTMVAASMAHPLPAPAPLSVSTWNSFASSSLGQKSSVLGPISEPASVLGPGPTERRGSDPAASILIRRLPASMSHDALRCILLFASDLIDVYFVSCPEDIGLQAAIAQFGSLAGASDACHQLNGKTMFSQENSLVVELLPHSGLPSTSTATPIAGSAINGLGSIGSGRHSRFFNSSSNNTSSTAASGPSTSALHSTAGPAPSSSMVVGPSGQATSSSGNTNNGLSAHSWLINSSAPLPRPVSQPASAIELPSTSMFGHSNQGDGNQASSRFTDILTQSATATTFSGFPTSLSVIPREDKNNQVKNASHLVAPPVSLAASQPAGIITDSVSLRPYPPTQQNSAQNVNVSLSSPPPQSNGSNRQMIPNQGTLSMNTSIISHPAPASAIASANPANAANNLWYSTPQQTPTVGPVSHFARHNLPPINPADQNPPCNTLYVGNLPLDTSEDELKAMFSKQRGFKRLCFRVKHNGPMCFVEFEDVSFATKALNDLYGYPLHNSVKGGIRLSFSKNPLGVRSGQNPANGTAHGMHQRLSTVSGPPPGLPAPTYYPVNPAAPPPPRNANPNPTCNTTATTCFPYSSDMNTRSFEQVPWNQPVAYTSQYHARPMGR